MSRHSCLAVCAPGLEDLLRAEMDALGLRPGTPLTGGVPFSGGDRDLYRANVHLSIASRILVRIARFPAREFWELEKHARTVPWETWVPPGGEAAFRVTSRTSRLFHADAVAERLAAAVAHRVPVQEAAAAPAIPFVVRLVHDRMTISADSSGEHLHRRGYRLATAKAPLRETLAAAMLAASGWPGDAPLLDPFGGAGTIVLEAARRALGIPPGLQRTFAFQSWPGYRPGTWASVVGAAKQGRSPATVAPILGSDRDAGAVARSRENADRAGVAEHVRFERHPFERLQPPAAEGWVVTNPPFGRRIAIERGAAGLHGVLASVFSGPFAGWDVTLLSADPALDAALGERFVEVFRTRTGGVPVRCLRRAT